MAFLSDVCYFLSNDNRKTVFIFDFDFTLFFSIQNKFGEEISSVPYPDTAKILNTLHILGKNTCYVASLRDKRSICELFEEHRIRFNVDNIYGRDSAKNMGDDWFDKSPQYQKIYEKEGYNCRYIVFDDNFNHLHEAIEFGYKPVLIDPVMGLSERILVNALRC